MTMGFHSNEERMRALAKQLWDALIKIAQPDTLDGVAEKDQAETLQLIAIEAMSKAPQPKAEPLFWFRPVGEDGGYEGPHHSWSQLGKMIRAQKPDQWKPLYPEPPAPQIHVADPDDLRKRIMRAIFDPGATEGFKGDRDLTTWQTDAVMRALATATEGRGE